MMDSFTCEPSPDLAQSANRAVHQALDGLLRATLSQVQRATGRSLPDVASAAERLLANRPVSPNLFSIQHGLSTALMLRDRDELVRLLSALLDSAPDAGGASLLVRSFGTEEADRAVSAFVTSPEGLGTSERAGPDMRPLAPDVSASCLTEAKAAVKRLSTLDPTLFAEAAAHVQWIALFEGAGVVGVSTRRAFGAIYIRAHMSEANRTSIAHYVEHVVHEAAHTHLNALMHLDPLVENDSAERFTSPLRNDPRPMRGIYHASFVLARLVRVFRRWYDKDGTEVLQSRLTSFRDKLSDGLDVISKHGQLTSYGAQLLNSMIEFSARNSKKNPERHGI